MNDIRRKVATPLFTGLRRLSFELRSLLAADPRLFALHRLLYVNWGQYKIRRKRHISPGEAIVGADTELVIDGYQGSANTFATVAFKYAQQQPVRLAHHLHSPAQVIRGVRMGLPVVVTVREPKDAVLSLIRRWPHITVKQALRWYIRFYEALIPYASEIVVSPFTSTTKKLDEVFREVNERFGTSFDPFTHSPEATAAVRGEPEQMKEKRRLAEAAKEKKLGSFETPQAQALLARADSVYTRFLRAGGKEK